MKKYLILLLTAVSLFISFGFSVNAGARSNASKQTSPRPTPKNKIALQSVILDKDKIELRCDNGITLREGAICSEAPLIKITTSVINPKNSKINYYYTVSGGKIAGEGDSVIWDLNDVRPGTYTVTIKIGNKSKTFGETITKTIQVRDCPECHMPCVCPTVEAFGGGNIKAGENVTFTAQVSGGSDTSAMTYNWTVSQGEIIAGQGTREITVKTTKEMNGTIEATVEVSAPGLCYACTIITASETAKIVQ